MLALIACTDSNEAIAQRLKISEGTLKRHINTLYRKTGTSNKIALIRWALREAYKAIKINSRTNSQAGMNLFQAQVHRPFSDDLVTVTEAMLIVATGIVKEAEPETVAPAFVISVSEDTVTAQVRRHDGREVYARLFFDGQRFILASEGFVEPLWRYDDSQVRHAVDQLTGPLPTAEVATLLQTTRQNLIMLLFRHPHLRPATRLPNGSFLWTADEIAAVVAHRDTEKRGRNPKRRIGPESSEG